MRASCPFLSHISCKMVPDANLRLVELGVEKLRDDVEATCSWACQSRSNVAPGLGKVWREAHQTVTGENVGLSEEPELEEEAEEEGDNKPCRDAGVCVCSEAGLRLKRCRNEFLRRMKSTFNTKNLKTQLELGQVAVRFSDTADTEGGEHALLLHVALMSWSPYKPTFQVLEEVAGAPAAPDHIVAKVTV